MLRSDNNSNMRNAINHLAMLPTKYPVPSGMHRLYVQLGSNLQPLLPMDSQTFVLLNDASPDIVSRLAFQLRDRRDCRIVWRAVANESGTLAFHITSEDNIGATLVLNRGGTGRTGDRTVLVAAGSLLDIIRPLPSHVPIVFLTSNIEGYDYTAFEQFEHHFRARGTQLAIAEMDTNGMAQYRGPGAVPPNEFRHFDALRVRIGWRWVACVADASAMMPCVLSGPDAKCLMSRYTLPLAVNQTDRLLTLPNRAAPTGFALHALDGDHLALLTVRSRTIPISTLQRPGVEATERHDRAMANTLTERCAALIRRPKKRGSWYHPMSRVFEASNQTAATIETEHDRVATSSQQYTRYTRKGACHSLFRWVHCAMAPAPSTR